MLVINRLGLRPVWLIPTHQNSKPLLMSQYTTVTHILFYKCSYGVVFGTVQIDNGT